MRPWYSFTKTNVGLRAGAVLPMPAAMPWTMHVFPAPSSPVRSTTSPDLRDSPMARPSNCVVCSEGLTTTLAPPIGGLDMCESVAKVVPAEMSNGDRRSVNSACPDCGL